MSRVSTFFVLAGGALLGGCASVASSYSTAQPFPRGRSISGPIYNLPQKAMTVTVGSDALGLFVDVGAARIEGDPSATYLLDYNPDSSSADELGIRVNPETGLLSMVRSDADSKLADAILALGRSSGRVSGLRFEGLVGAPVIHGRLSFVPWRRAGMSRVDAEADVGRLNDEINALVAAVVDFEGCRQRNDVVLDAAERGRFCAGNALRPQTLPRVVLSLDYTPFAMTSSPASCVVGICTRQQSIAEIRLTAHGVTQVSRLPLPNGSAPVPLALSRVGFARAKTDYTLVDGLVSRSRFESGAALPTIFALPGNLIGSVVGGFVTGVADAGRLRQAKADAAGGNAASSDGSPDPQQPAATAPDGDTATDADETPQEAPSVPGAGGSLVTIYVLPRATAKLEALRTGPATKASGSAPTEAGSAPTDLGRTTDPGGR